MAKKARRAGKRTSKKRKTKKRSAGAAVQARLTRRKNGLQRARLHAAAAALADFHGGKGPIKSGCGRPRKK